MDANEGEIGLPELSPREKRRRAFRRGVYVVISAVWIGFVLWFLGKRGFPRTLVSTFGVFSLIILGAPLFNLGIRMRARAAGWRLCPKCYRYGGSEREMLEEGIGAGLEKRYVCGKCGKKMTFEELRMKWSGWM